MYTEDEIYMYSGMNSPTEFRNRTLEINIEKINNRVLPKNELYRRTGRTTQSMVKHLTRLLNGRESYLVFPNYRMVRIAEDAIYQIVNKIILKHSDFFKKDVIISNFHIYSVHEQEPFLLLRSQCSDPSCLIYDHTVEMWGARK